MNSFLVLSSLFLLLLVSTSRAEASRVEELRALGWTIPSDYSKEATKTRGLLDTPGIEKVPAPTENLLETDKDIPVPITKHYAEVGPGIVSESSDAAIAAQSTDKCKCIRSGERCIQLGFECSERSCLRAEVQCEKIDTVCTQYVQQCHESQCIDWARHCIEEISTCVEVHHDQSLGTTCLRQATQCLKWGFTCTNTMCVKQSYECVKRAAPICVSFRVDCITDVCASQEVKCQTPEKTCLEFEEGCEP